MQVNSTYLLIAMALAWGLMLPAGAQENRLACEAEELTQIAQIVGGGGDLLIIRAPDPAKLKFSGGRALVFTPNGKSSGLALTITMAKEGVFTLRVRGVMGPSCGNYQLYVNGEERGNFNFYNRTTVHTNQNPPTVNGLVSKRFWLNAGNNTLRFDFVGAQGRGAALVLDTLELIPEVKRTPTYTYTPYDKTLPPGEKLGSNMVKNGGFEDFLPQDTFTKQHQLVKSWMFNSAVPVKHPPIVRDKTLAHSGNQAILLAPDPLEDNTAIYTMLPVYSGHRYRVSFYARGKGSIIAMYYLRAPAKSEDTTNGYVTFKTTPDWSLYSYIFEPSRSGQVTSAGFALYAADNESEVYFDDVAVQEILP
ncbi:MAG: hypothetical protein ACYC7E_01205 [Armatimonadota bacterium]